MTQHSAPLAAFDHHVLPGAAIVASPRAARRRRLKKVDVVQLRSQECWVEYGCASDASPLDEEWMKHCNREKPSNPGSSCVPKGETAHASRPEFRVPDEFRVFAEFLRQAEPEVGEANLQPHARCENLALGPSFTEIHACCFDCDVAQCGSNSGPENELAARVWNSGRQLSVHAQHQFILYLWMCAALYRRQDLRLRTLSSV